MARERSVYRCQECGLAAPKPGTCPDCAREGTYVQLVEEGISMDLIDRIHAPVGLDVGAETPEEIAVAVAAELVMVRRGGTGAPLKGVERVAERYFGTTQLEGKEPK